MSGKGVKFLFFADQDSEKTAEQQFNDFMAQVAVVQRATGLMELIRFDTISKLDEAKNYRSILNGQINARAGAGDQRQVRGEGSAAGSLDLFRGVVDSLLAPYISAGRRATTGRDVGGEKTVDDPSE